MSASGFWDNKDCLHERREAKYCEDCETMHAFCSDCKLPEHLDDQLALLDREREEEQQQHQDEELLTPIIEISEDSEPEQDEKQCKRERPASPIYRVEKKVGLEPEQKYMKYGEQPDLFWYFQHFDTSPERDIGICRTYANHLASLIPKARPTSYKKQKK